MKENFNDNGKFDYAVHNDYICHALFCISASFLKLLITLGHFNFQIQFLLLTRFIKYLRSIMYIYSSFPLMVLDCIFALGNDYHTSRSSKETLLMSL